MTTSSKHGTIIRKLNLIDSTRMDTLLMDKDLRNMLGQVAVFIHPAWSSRTYILTCLSGCLSATIKGAFYNSLPQQFVSGDPKPPDQ